MPHLLCLLKKENEYLRWNAEVQQLLRMPQECCVCLRKDGEGMPAVALLFNNMLRMPQVSTVCLLRMPQVYTAWVSY